ncbi:hypothetical protein AGMMS49579_26480 [Spirochaetia bacterium]|nr:hypothetical protein AGMMS49579_26480 [Spirochaetia bacterium]
MRIKMMHFGSCLVLTIVFIGCLKQQPVKYQNEISSGDITLAVDDNAPKQQAQINELTFESLRNGKMLKHEIEDDNQNVYLIIYDSENIELMRIEVPYSRNYDNMIRYSKSRTYMVIECKPNAPDIFELWLIDGNNGIARKIIRPFRSYLFQIDDECIYICLDDTMGSNAPRVAIRNIKTMELIKTIIYEPYYNKGMYSTEMYYENDAFVVTLSADTVNYTKIEIPINGPEEYQVLESYDWEVENKK